jgi:formylglycine-generating enzyme required for sulfatase activity
VDVPNLPPVAPVAPALAEAQVAEAKRLGVPAWFDNAQGMRFVLIPPGTFAMGGPEGAARRLPDEGCHDVTISRAFYLQTTETTWGQLRRWDSAATTLHGRPEDDPWDADDLPALSNNSGKYVENFADWLSAKDAPRHYRLPTEAEWEWACRAGTTTAWSWGDDAAGVTRFANVADRSDLAANPKWSVFPIDDDGFHGSAPVASFFPNPWGLYDMVGNVGEWVEDGYAPYPKEAQTDPAVPRTTERVYRGGSWYDGPYQARCAARGHATWDSEPLVPQGFRLVVEVPAPAK